jgi:TonB family protein
VLHVVDVDAAASNQPHGPFRAVIQLLVSATLHAVAAVILVTFAADVWAPPSATPQNSPVSQPVDVRHIVFIAPRQLSGGGGGGGGGGNRQRGPIRHAEAIGHDDMTLRVARPLVSTQSFAPAPAPAEILLEAKPLASGTAEQIGLPVGGVTFGTSTGPGSGGGVGEGVGTGIGSGRGPGIGPGSGGGIGGGVYRPGGAVTAPRVIVETKPKYTTQALSDKIQGTVILELVVRADGHPSDIRVIRSLDPDGLDDQAVLAVSQWRFEPGRLGGRAVDVLVTVMLDFWIR